MKITIKSIGVLLLTILLSLCCEKSDLPWFEESGTRGVFTDSRDGNEYKYTVIGNQKWMAENLRYLPKLNLKTDISSQEPRYYILNFENEDVSSGIESVEYLKFGTLYNFQAAVNACPRGWKIPSDEDWKELELFLGMDSMELDTFDLRNSGEIGMKLMGIDGWGTYSHGNNLYGFNALPGGLLSPYDGWSPNTDPWFFGYFWTNSMAPGFESEYRISRYFWGGYRGIVRTILNDTYGLSLRCIKK